MASFFWYGILNELEEYYNKFNEDKRLRSRRGIVEYTTAMHYINDCLMLTGDGSKVLDIGAGTGAYSIPLSEAGYDVTAIEIVQHNLGRLKAKSDKVKAMKGDARDLSRIEDDSFDVVLLFGPMYHIHGDEEKLCALSEAKRVCKKSGYILTSYCMNDYAVIEHGFMEGMIMEDKEKGYLDDGYIIKDGANPLYSYVRKEDIDRLNKKASLKRVKLVSEDGLSSLIRRELKKMTDEIFDEYLKYHLSVCERADMWGHSAHLLDITVGM